jgi:high affinity Mn2+ porin
LQGALLNLRVLVKFRLLITLMLLAFLCSTTLAQSGESDEQNSESKPPVTIFPHSDTSRFWVSGQMNFVFQSHPEFPAKYSGTNSFHNYGETGFTRVLTLYTGWQITPKDELLFDLEESGGGSLSTALGLAGYTDLDAVRIPGAGSPLSTAPYMGRVMYHHIFALSRERVAAERNPLSLFTQLPARRLEFRIGKFSAVDFFDLNSVGSDSHLQFLNWAVDNNGAYDYGANTRGYTYGAILDYEERNWGFRFGETMMPKVANGEQLDADMTRARAENMEFELRPKLLKDRKTAFRALSYVNHGNMGDYRQAIALVQGSGAAPVIENTRRQGTIKYGFGFNAEQELTRDLRLGARWGWNEGRHETFAFTEIDSTAELCADYVGRSWKRRLDKVGLAFASNGISKDHQEYLRLGGLGFLLGDGNLNYGRENIVEFYYTAHFWRGIFASFDLQHINNPGYNRDRGPVLVPTLRLHIDL